MSRFVRQSKVRHVYVDTPKKDYTYQDLPLATAIGDHNFIKGNEKYFAVAVGSHGSLAVFEQGKYGKVGTQPPTFDGHKEPVLDFDFNPFYDNIIASGSNDCTIKVWGIPDGGLKSNVNDPLVDIHGHRKKVVCLRFHPTAEHVLASASADQTVKIWDIEKGESKVSCDAHPGLLQDIEWIMDDGSLLASSCKDKLVRIIDPRTGEVTSSVEAHTGTKTCKLAYLGLQNKFVTCGFTRQSKRQFKIWDPRKFDKAIHSHDIDQASGIMMPFYDEDSHILYIAGKGDGNIRFFEIIGESPWTFEIDNHKSTTSTKGLCMLPKRSVDVTRCEVTRLMKLTNNGVVEPLSCIVPRKSDMFQDDLFPDCRSGKPSLSADDFFGGKNKKPILMSLNPKTRKSSVTSGKKFTAPKSASALQEELNKANARIKELEKKLKDAGISC